jgi:hypothetical protein
MSFDETESDDESGDGNGRQAANPEQDCGCRNARIGSDGSASRAGCNDDSAADFGVIGRSDRDRSRLGRGDDRRHGLGSGCELKGENFDASHARTPALAKHRPCLQGFQERKALITHRSNKLG